MGPPLDLVLFTLRPLMATVTITAAMDTITRAGTMATGKKRHKIRIMSPGPEGWFSCRTLEPNL